MAIDIKQLVTTEIQTINKLLAAHRINAGTSIKRTVVVPSAFVSYGLSLAPGEQLRKIAAIQRELSNALTNKRVRLLNARQRITARLSDYPPAIEVQHPRPEVLGWSYRKFELTPPHAMLAGRSFVHGPKDEYVSFDDSPHALIVGITGAGKSVLQQIMLLTLCHSTPSDELRIVLVDLKNEDMTPFANLPHVMRFAGSLTDAMDAIRMVQAEKDARIANPHRKPYRLVLWIDELAQLALDKTARDMLGDIASIGRSKAINLIASTQHPTKEGGMGSLMKANFPLRLVGMVAPGQSHVATGRAQAHADLLPGKGAFLRCQGPDVYRIQSYFITHDDAVDMADYVRRFDLERGKKRTGGDQTGDRGGDLTGDQGGDQQSTTSTNDTGTITSDHHHLFPLSEGRPLRTVEAQTLRRMVEAGEFDYQGQVSLNRVVKFVYGDKNPDRFAWVKQALSSIEQEAE